MKLAHTITTIGINNLMEEGNEMILLCPSSDGLSENF